MNRCRTIYPGRGWLRVLWPKESANDFYRRCAATEVGEIPGCKLTDSWLEVPYTAWMLDSVLGLLDELGAQIPRDDGVRFVGGAEIGASCGSRVLYDHQIAGAEFILSRPSTILADEMGVGKFQPTDAKVLTPIGWRAIGELGVGDFVLGSDGGACEVTGVYPQGVQPIYRVRFSDGSSVEAGGAHLWTVGYRRGGRVWAELTLTTDELRLRGRHKNIDLAKTALYLPMLSAPCLFAPSTALPVDAYTLGALIANGYLHSTAAFSFNIADRAHFESRLELGAIHVYGGAGRASIRNVIGAIRELGLCVPSREKFIPVCYLRAAPKDRLALLQGLMDCDGSISATQNRVSYSTMSPRLADNVVELVEGLGGLASISVYNRTDEDKGVEHDVRIRLPAWATPFSAPRKLARYNPESHATPRRTVVGVEYTRDTHAVCIRMNADDALYVTERHILTHNTTTAAIAASIAARVYTPRPILIIGTLAVQQTWRRELQALGLTHAPEDFCALESRNVKDASFWRRAKWYFIHYEIVKAWWSYLSGERPCVTILDEAHYVRNSKTLRSSGAALASAGSHKRILLTGTPIENRPSDLFNPLTIACGAKTWGFWSSFRKRYCGAESNGYNLVDTGPTNIEELKARLAAVYLRRTTLDAGIDLPTFTRTTQHCELGQFKTEYESVINSLEDFDLGELSTLVRAIAEGLQQKVLPELTRLRQITSRAKVAATREYVINSLEQGEAVVVFAWEREIAAEIFNGLGSFPKLLTHGGVSQRIRDAAIDEFQGSRDPIAMVTTYGAMKEGVTLHRARICVLHDQDWTLSSMLQAEKRVHRLGQTRNCLAVWMLAAKSMDTLIAPILLRKAELMDQILGIRYDIKDDIGLTELAGRKDADAMIAQALAAWDGARQ